MPKFPSKTFDPYSVFRRHPTWFGIPFVLIIVATSFGLQQFTQLRYDLHAQKVSAVSSEERAKLKKKGRRLDIREEYFKLMSKGTPDWEPVRVPRPAGVPEWGVPPDSAENTPSVKTKQ